MKGSLTATSSTSSLWRTTLATKRPILPNPIDYTNQTSDSLDQLHIIDLTNLVNQRLTVDSDLDLTASYKHKKKKFRKQSDLNTINRLEKPNKINKEILTHYESNTRERENYSEDG